MTVEQLMESLQKFDLNADVVHTGATEIVVPN